uniref:PAT1 homolog 2 n=1 Tax=Amphilophus citrinellus TaxID=61819 RepID=A0A3Q0S9C7_AMPCI
MTAKEKEWITRLQMIQLQSENPYLEDYYYQEYYRRIEAKMAEEELGIRSKREPPKLTTPYVKKTDSYTPVVHIEGSLGQVAVSTCYSPRRAISAVHAAQEQKDTRLQRLEILSKIEKVDGENPEESRAHLHPAATPQSPVSHTVSHLPEIVNLHLNYHVTWNLNLTFLVICRDSGGDFLPFLLVSKGKKLIARLLPFLKHDSGLKILCVVTSNLPALMGRDTEEVGQFCFCFGLSLLYALLSQGEKLLSSGVPLEPSIGDFETWTDIIFQVAGQLSQCSLVEPLLLPSNLLTLFCRYLDKRTVHQLKNNME